MIGSHLINRSWPRGCSIFLLERGATRKHIRPAVAGRPRSNGVQTKKRRHPKGKSTLGPLAALLAPYLATAGRVCSSLAPCRPPQIALARPTPIYEMASKIRLLVKSKLNETHILWRPLACLGGLANGRHPRRPRSWTRQSSPLGNEMACRVIRLCKLYDVIRLATRRFMPAAVPELAAADLEAIS